MKKLLIGLALAALSAQAGMVNIVDQTRKQNADMIAGATNLIDTYTVQEGDVIAFTASANAASRIQTNDLSFSGTAGFAWTEQANVSSGGGAIVTYWYGTSTSTGTLDLNYIFEANHTAIAGYQLRAADTGEHVILGSLATFTQKHDSANGSPALVYDFGSQTYESGISIEAFSSYNAWTGIPVDTTDSITANNKFGAGHSTFSTSMTGTDLTSAYTLTLDGTNAAAIAGMTFVAVPEPATIGLISMFGGSLLVIRRIFSI